EHLTSDQKVGGSSPSGRIDETRNVLGIRGKHIFRRYWLPTALSLAVIALAGQVRSIVDSRGSAPPAGVTLELPASYVVFSPISRTLDALTLLSTAQSIALFISIAVLVALTVVLTKHRTNRALWKRLALAFVILPAVIVAFESAAVFLPREMAAIKVADPQIVRVDFHSHTGTSHDVRKSYGPEDNRDWHRSGGFDIAYVTDHVKFQGAVEARRHNPRKAGDGTSLLTGVEGRYHRIISTIVLGLTEADTSMLNKRGNLLAAIGSSAFSPVTIIALPSRNLDSLTTAVLDSNVSLTNLSAIELVDAAPRGLAQFDREENRIRQLASNLGLILVAASNNHGFGRTVAAWNVMSVPGWRDLSPDSVGALINEQLRGRQSDVVVIVRRMRPRLHGMAAAATLPVLGFQIVGGLTPVERAAWLAWIWLATAAIVVRNKKTRRDPDELTDW
ncbi:MAG: hypothetical protein ABI556_15555, partial [Gemmatimonadales bacterium]